MSADLTPLRNSVVRINGLKGNYAGLGYRISADIVVTCAHVVAAALHYKKEAADPPAGQVLVDAPFAIGEDAQTQIEASVAPNGWLPVREGNAPADLAVLRLTGPLPLTGPLALLDAGLSLAGHTFRAYGGPKGHERHLVPIDGRVRDVIGNGRYQLSAADSDYPIQPGCSGAPATNSATGMILGLIAQDELDPTIRAGFLIPAAHLRHALTQTGIVWPAPPGLAPLRAWADARLRLAGFQLAGQVRRFVDYYAGAPDRPMPFAGRDSELMALDRELDQGGAFRLLTGAAGLGKSTLLLRWLARVLGREEPPHLVFLPVSIRFDTADELRGLRLLYAQLAGFFGELCFPESARPDQDDYRDRIGKGWETIVQRPHKRFLLVIDGADEASGDWLKTQVLPYAIPPNLTIILAARYKPGQPDGQAWLADFAFDPACPKVQPLDLQPLSKAAVGEAVAQLGHPLDALPEREGVLDALYRLTDRGDPLLVTLWVGQLWRERERAPALRATDLQQLSPSFAGFLEVWMQEQAAVWKAKQLDVHPDDARRLLRVLSLARGPLHLQDLLAVVARLPFPVRWEFERARTVLDSAFRLVVGDAGQQGYTFIHPRLGDHFRAELEGIKEERLAVPRAYVEWGTAIVAALNDGSLPPEQCPVYLLHHYTAHVQEAKLAPDDALDRYLLPLLGKGWHQAWYAEEGAYGGFLADLRRVQDVIRQANRARRGPPYRIGAELRCHLIRASLFSRTQNLPPRLIVALVDAGEWSLQRAVRVVEQLSDPIARFLALYWLAQRSTGVECQQILQQALEAAARLGKEEDRAVALAAVAAHLGGQPTFLQQVLNTATGIGNAWHRARALAAVAKHLTGDRRQQVLQQALDTATGIDDAENRARVLAAVAKHLTGEQRQQVLQQALDTATGIGDEKERAWALAAVVEHLTGEQRQQVLQQAMDAAAGIGEEYNRARAMAAVAAHLAGEQRQRALQQALDAVAGIGEEYNRARAMAAVAAHLGGQPTLLQQAMDAVTRIGDEMRRAEVLTAVAAHLAGEQRQRALQQALDVVARIGEEWNRSEALAVVAAHLGGQPTLLQQALDTATGIGEEWNRATALAAVAAHLGGQPTLLQQTLDAATRFGNEWGRAGVLTAVAAHLGGQPTLLQQALDAAAGIGDEKGRAKVLTAVAGYLAGEQRQQVLEQALDAAAGIGDKRYRSEALAVVAVHLGGQPTLLQQALDAATRIGDEKGRAEVLTAVAAHLAGEQRQHVLQQALDVAAGIGDERTRAWTMTAVAAHLGGQLTLLQKALDAAAGIGDGGCRAETLAAVAAHLGGQPTLLQQALDTATGINDAGHRAKSLAAVVVHLGGQPTLLQQALDTATGINDAGHRARALAAVAAHLAGERHQQVLQQALHAAAGIDDAGNRARAVAAVAAHLAGEQRQHVLQQALDAAAGIGDEKERAEVLTAVAAHLAGKKRQQVLEQALDAAAGIGNEEERAEVLTAVAAHLAGKKRQQVLEQALDAAAGIGNEEDGARAKVLTAVAAHLAGKKRQQVLEQALDAAAGIGNEEDGARANVLTAVAAHLAGKKRQQVLEQALDAAATGIEIDPVGRWSSVRALAAVAGYLAGEKRQQVLQQVLNVAAGIDDSFGRAWVLSAVAKHLTGQPALLQQALNAAAEIGEVNRTWALKEVADAWSIGCDYLHLIQILDAMVVTHRTNWLVLVQGLLSIISQLGGKAALGETADAILDTARRWP